MSTKVYSGHSNGGGSVTIVLAPGSYSLVAHHSANPRAGATEPPASTEDDPGLTVTDSAGAVIRQGPGSFAVAQDGSFAIAYGPVPKVVELWQLDASGGVAPAAMAPASITPASAPPTAPAAS